MAPVALFVCCCLIYWLFQRDKEIRQLSSNALWIPALLLGIIGSKPLSLWLGQLGLGYSRGDRGSVDQIYYAVLVVAAVVVLIKRRFEWSRFALSNKALILMYLFWLASCFWAPSGTAAFKRLFRDFGAVVIGMIFLTEKDPWQAIRTVFVRLAYIIFPLSIVLSRYFPGLGRSATRGGQAMYTGVASHKNSMGVIALIFGLVVFADLLSLRKENPRRVDLWIRYGLLATCLWILVMVDSKTALFCLFLGCALFWLTGRLAKLDHPAQVMVRLMGAILVIALCETTFGISSFIIEDLLGRDTTLTGRTEIWAAVRQAGTNPVFGVGYSSFWDTPAAHIIGEGFPGGLVTSHNGFIETYLDGGIVAEALLILSLLTWLHTAVRETLSGTIGGQLTLVVWIIAILYNNSETSFFRGEPLWFTLLVLTNRYKHEVARHHGFKVEPGRRVRHSAEKVRPVVGLAKSRTR